MPSGIQPVFREYHSDHTFQRRLKLVRYRVTCHIISTIVSDNYSNHPEYFSSFITVSKKVSEEERKKVSEKVAQ